jgi:hypothetical protein
MCGCGNGGKKNINFIQQKNRIMLRKNKFNQHVSHSTNNIFQQQKINQRRIARFNINFPRTLLNSNKNYPFLVNRKNW